MSRHQPAEICSNRSSCRIRSSRSKHREIEDVALHYQSFDTSPKLTSESSDRENTSSSAETSSQWNRTSPLHGTHDKSLQSTMNYDDDIRKDLHVEARGLRETAQKHGDACSGWPVSVTPQRRAFARLRVVL